MNRKEIFAVVALIFALMTWPMVAPKIERQLFPSPPDVQPVESTEAGGPTNELSAALSEATAPTPEALVERAPAPAADPATEAEPTPEPPVAEEVSEAPESTIQLANDVVQLTFSSRGASLAGAVLDEYPQTLEDGSPAVSLDFSPHAALVYHQLPGIGAGKNLALSHAGGGSPLVATGQLDNGISFERRIRLSDGYVLEVVDTFRNKTGAVRVMPAHSLQVGSMQMNKGTKAPTGMYYLGVDALLHGGRGVEYFGKKLLPKALKKSSELTVALDQDFPVDWLAVKNRYFIQILRPNDDTLGVTVLGAKESSEKSPVSEVAGRINFTTYTLAPEQEFTRTSELYVGPKKYSIIRDFGRHKTEVMEFGFFSPICKFLLWVLNQIHDRLWPFNYGIAIMLLTVIIRTIFWPVTHKGTESMRKMQEIAPLMQEVKEKYKDSPEKQQKAMLELYKENKVNPVGGCLPMLIQIPVFFALFVVLRSAIEMRFAGFLWIDDLSEPENLMKGLLPFGLGLNILPILNAACMWLQQKLTPTTGDPNQAKIMQFMPIMMLVLFYNFASGLVLYWTTNQVLMMTQQILYHRKKDKEKASA